VHFEVSDGSLGDSEDVVITVNNTNRSPVADAGTDQIADEESQVTFDASASTDPDGDTLQYRWDFESDGSWDTSWSNDATTNYTWHDDYAGTVTVEVSDGQLTDTATFTVTINNVAPELGTISASLDPTQVNVEVTASADFTDVGILDTHTATWDWGDTTTTDGIVSETNGSGTSTGTHTYTTPGVYTLTLTLTDDDGGSSEAIFQYIVIYDPEGGFVTGGGWIDSPEGAFTDDSTLTGKANFGFVSKYKKGASVPTGNTKFHFKVADLKFESTEYDWLVVAGAKAQYKGSGTINGAGNYGFMLMVIDEELTPSTDTDIFRINIWDKDNGDAVVYDSQLGADEDAYPTTEIGGGSIVIHK
jgi:PKD repeat protein